MHIWIQVGPMWSPSEAQGSPDGAQMSPNGFKRNLKGESNCYGFPSKVKCSIRLIAHWPQVHFDTVSEKKKVPKSALIPDKRVLSISKKVTR